MIIENGTIELKRKSVGAAAVDPETGYPVKPASAVWGEPIPCQYYANRYSNLGRTGGEHYTDAEYTVLVDLQPIDAEQLRLKDRSGQIVGEFSIIQAEPLEAVCETRIIV